MRPAVKKHSLGVCVASWVLLGVRKPGLGVRGCCCVPVGLAWGTWAWPGGWCQALAMARHCTRGPGPGVGVGYWPWPDTVAGYLWPLSSYLLEDSLADQLFFHLTHNGI